MTPAELRKHIDSALDIHVKKSGMTSREYAQTLKVSERTAQRTIKELMAVGKAHLVGKRVVVDMVGKRQLVPVYTMKLK